MFLRPVIPHLRLIAAILLIPSGLWAEIKISPDTVFLDSPAAVRIECSNRSLRLIVTTNGAAPSGQNGFTYRGPFKIDATCLLRVAGLDESGAVVERASRTILFPSSLMNPSVRGLPEFWGERNGMPVVADYGMDPELLKESGFLNMVSNSWMELPGMALILDPRDLFGPAHGIYSHPMETGALWEKVAAVEYWEKGGARKFQVPCGIRIQGGWNRRPEESPKHSFRIVFRKRYGLARLGFPLFGGESPSGCGEFVLRAGCNNSWLHWSGEERRQGDYIRDQWVRDSHREMGHASPRGFFVHLFLNGIYWGLYNPVERPGAEFAADRSGGAAWKYDARNGDKMIDGDDRGWNAFMKFLDSPESRTCRLDELASWLDVDGFADLMLVNLFGANGDWDGSSNWYASRRREPPGPWSFHCWDGERTLEKVADDAWRLATDQSPLGVFTRLRSNPEFRKAFGHRAQRHLGRGGLLAPEAATARFQRHANVIRSSIWAESARWGDYRRDVHPYKTGPYELYRPDTHWEPEVQRLLKDYFPARTAEFVRQLRRENLWE